MKYFVYCRKSSEAEERQAQSIDSQKREADKVFSGRPDIEIVEILVETMSAKAPGRPIFLAMLNRIQRGEAEGIIAWHPDRLARNSIDGGQLIYMLDQGVLKDMKFVNFTFENSSEGKFMLQIMFGYSKYYVDSLSTNVKRGIREKLAKGWRPNSAPIGYLNDRNTSTIILDPERAHLVRRIFDLALIGTRSLRELRDEAKALNLRTRPRVKSGGKCLSMSAIHRMLHNPFYSGQILWNGALHPGAHQPLITRTEFVQLQRNAGRKGKTAYIKHEFPLTGLISCGECGMSITAEQQVNRHGSKYIYYHCSRRRRDYKCRQPFMRDEVLVTVIERSLSSISMPERLYKKFLDALGGQRDELQDESAQTVSNLDKAIAQAEKTLLNIISLRAREFINEEEFLIQRKIVQEEIVVQRETRNKLGGNDIWFESIEILISFSKRATKWFIQGDVRIKRTILKIVCSNLTLEDKKVSIQARKPFLWVSNLSVFPDLRAVLNDVRTWPAEDVREFFEVIAMIKDLMQQSPELQTPSAPQSQREAA